MAKKLVRFQIKDATKKDPAEIARKIKELAQKATRSSKSN